jgi:hypothetical protein
MLRKGQVSPAGVGAIMRRAILCALTVAAWAALVAVSHAQSPYNYSWCGAYRFGAARSCYYNSYEQCMETYRPVLGFCIRNPAYRGPAADAAQARRKRRASPQAR